ncbi:hypothetical protein DY000_02041777 [Brassica cretica]|uniref:Uncharacterized protein n=1 Tax=Brassica cretica TaxID=69181 RepID=A0ABQ7BL02_BRACR|nr:hypothetical protein DY000_02041777 [Brassica cretica]
MRELVVSVRDEMRELEPKMRELEPEKRVRADVCVREREHWLTEQAKPETHTPIPDMMFAPREEPIVVRFLSYQFSRTINVIFNSLNGLFIWQDSGNNRYTGFIGRFAKYLISRHLKVNKKYEAWFRFADPTRPIVESTLVWSDELANKKFGNLLALIYQNPVYSNEMFKGGVTKIDVERMREEAKVHAREKKTKKPYLAKQRNQTSNPPPNVDASYITPIVLDKLKLLP